MSEVHKLPSIERPPRTFALENLDEAAKRQARVRSGSEPVSRNDRCQNPQLRGPTAG